MFALLHLATPSEKCSVGDSATTLQYAQSAACHLMAVDAILGMSRNLARASFEVGRVGEGLECLHVAALSVDDARAWFDLAEVSRIECRGYCMAASALAAVMCRHVGSTAASTRRTTHTSLPQIEIRSGHSFTSMTVRRNSLGPATVDMRGSVGTAVSSANTVKELGRQQLAITLYKKALELNPPFTTAVRTRPVFCEARAELMKSMHAAWYGSAVATVRDVHRFRACRRYSTTLHWHTRPLACSTRQHNPLRMRWPWTRCNPSNPCAAAAGMGRSEVCSNGTQCWF